MNLSRRTLLKAIPALIATSASAEEPFMPVQEVKSEPEHLFFQVDYSPPFDLRLSSRKGLTYRFESNLISDLQKAHVLDVKSHLLRNMVRKFRYGHYYITEGLKHSDGTERITAKMTFSYLSPFRGVKENHCSNTFHLKEGWDKEVLDFLAGDRR